MPDTKAPTATTTDTVAELNKTPRYALGDLLQRIWRARAAVLASDTPKFGLDYNLVLDACLRGEYSGDGLAPDGPPDFLAAMFELEQSGEFTLDTSIYKRALDESERKG